MDLDPIRSRISASGSRSDPDPIQVQLEAVPIQKDPKLYELSTHFCSVFKTQVQQNSRNANFQNYKTEVGLFFGIEIIFYGLNWRSIVTSLCHVTEKLAFQYAFLDRIF